MMNEKIVSILAEYTDLNADEIQGSSKLVDDLGLTSLDVLDMIAAFEDAFDIEIPDKVIKQMQTVSDIENYLNEKD